MGFLKSKGTVSEEQASLARSSDPEFVIQDPDEAAACVIDDSGGVLCIPLSALDRLIP